MTRKVITIGNSVGVTLDKKMLQELGLNGLSEVWIEPDKNKKQILIRKRTERDW